MNEGIFLLAAKYFDFTYSSACHKIMQVKTRMMLNVLEGKGGETLSFQYHSWFYCSIPQFIIGLCYRHLNSNFIAICHSV